MQRFRLFHRRQVLADKIFDQGQLGRFSFHIDGGNRLHACPAGGLDATFPGNDEKAIIAVPAEQDRLQKTVFENGLSQFFQRLGVEMLSRLFGISQEAVDRNVVELTFDIGLGFVTHCFEPPDPARFRIVPLISRQDEDTIEKWR